MFFTTGGGCLLYILRDKYPVHIINFSYQVLFIRSKEIDIGIDYLKGSEKTYQALISLMGIFQDFFQRKRGGII